MEAVDRADRAGNRGEAERALAAARAAAPDHPGVLNVAGMRALIEGDAAAARPLLERATALDPRYYPALLPAERDLVSVVTAGVQEYNEGESPFRQGG
jgi:hypothetical protein